MSQSIPCPECRGAGIYPKAAIVPPPPDVTCLECHGSGRAYAATLRQQAARVDDGMVRNVFGNIVKSMRATGHSWGPTRQAQVLDTWADEIETTVEAALSAQPAPARQGEAFGYVRWRADKGHNLRELYAEPQGDLGTGWKDVPVYLHPAAPVGVPEPIPLDDDVRAILGRMCFQCIRLANRLKQLGHVIENRAEAEQAAVLHWMLNHYLKHGKEWCKFADAELNAAAPSAPQGTQQGEG